MLTVNKLVPQGRGLAPVLIKRAASVELGWDERQKSRLEATDSLGRRLGIFLTRGQVMRGGDLLVAEDGSLVRVLAAPQPVLQVRACAEHGTPLDLLRAAYHLGNRHVAIEVQADVLQIEPDPVLAQMLRGRHLIVTEAQSAFEPEAGAYAAAAEPHEHHAHGPAATAAHAPHDEHSGHGGHGGHDNHGHDHDHGHDHANGDHGHHGGHDKR